MSNVKIERPFDGGVTLELSYDDAEILLRAVGMINTGNLSNLSPSLLSIVGDLVEEYGRNLDTEARKYKGFLFAGQVYVDDIHAE